MMRMSWLGHVATPSTVVTLEATVGTFQHKQATSGATLLDTSDSVMVGAQHYTNPSVWIRGAAGLNVHTIDEGTMGTAKMVGPAGAVGAGVDIVRRHFWVFGLELFGISAVNRNGVFVTGGLGLGISRY
jgi:hypothetical protein